MKKLLISGIAAAVLTVGAIAADFGPRPANYEASAEAYITDRLSDPRGAEFAFVGEPYRVFADVAGYEGLACWAIDVRVKERLPGGRMGGYTPFTVLFLEGQPIAFEEDARRMVRA
jgi:hypothetical protein